MLGAGDYSIDEEFAVDRQWITMQAVKKENPEDQIKKLLLLQKAKSDLSEEEIRVTKVW